MERPEDRQESFPSEARGFCWESRPAQCQLEHRNNKPRSMEWNEQDEGGCEGTEEDSSLFSCFV